MRYRISDDAEQDLDEIFFYWAERTSASIVDRLVEGIVERFWLLGEFPESGRQTGNIGPGIRCFPAGEYLIYYRKAGEHTDILHIFHGAREQTRAFNKKTRKPRR